MSRAKLTRRGLELRGTVTDTGCEGRVTRVLASVALKKGRKCRFLNHRGKVGKATSCARPKLIPVKGTSPFRLKLKAKLPRGTYQVGVRATDFAGNVEKLKFKTTKVR